MVDIPAPHDSHQWPVWTTRLAGVGLALTLLATGAFAVWTSQATSAAASKAVAASRLADDYAQAATALAAEESWERRYRLLPSPSARTEYEQATAVFTAAIARIQRAGSVFDRSLVVRVSSDHQALLLSSEALFEAVDRGDQRAAERIDRIDIDPPRAVVQSAVAEGVEAARDKSLAELDRLQSLERLVRLLTPLVVLLGLVIAALLSRITRRYRRQLLAERTRALYDSLHDPLSGLPNRRMLTERLERTLDQVDDGPAGNVALLLIDLDRFKEVNDTFGHRYGDELLTQIGPRLAQSLRSMDMIARLGGDEFAVLVPGMSSVAEAVLFASNLRLALEPAFHVFGVDLNVEASIGVVVAGEHGKDSVTLYQRADIAMYAAKAHSLGVCSYREEIDQHSPSRLAMFGELRAGLERDELVLHYQPQVSIATGELIGVEALVRWQHPDRGLIFPDEFIPLAEHTGLIVALTRFVLDAAINQARVWAEAGQPLKVSVNLSAKNLLEDDLPELVADLLLANGVGPELLEIEVTESAIVSDPARALRTLQGLVALRVRLSIDDFGAGYTSLGQLKILPVSDLKIDKSFVLAMDVDPASARIVEGIISIGHNLGYEVVAEGVETEAALDALRLAGCDGAQGYYFSRPLSVVDLQTWRVGHSQRLQTREKPSRVGV